MERAGELLHLHRPWEFNTVRKATLERLTAKNGQLQGSCVVVLRYGFLTPVCGVYKKNSYFMNHRRCPSVSC